MNAYKMEAVVAENGTVTLRGLPFQVGDTVEVIVLEQRPNPQRELSDREPAVDRDYLLGVEAQLSEWVSAEDEAAYHDL
ncbi:hypothetical protein ACQ4N7_07005 [Nodosilinea sp. AN01ver1]|uniref:hypothetical protein n=1 Tax=Nodosilinea sp. AN01ver1 TaxID=3423362 RepID=UPI003D31023B